MRVQQKMLVLAVAAAVVCAMALMLGLGAGAGPAPTDIGPGDLVFETVEIAPSADTTLYAWDPTTNMSLEWNLMLRSGDVAAPLFQFDLGQMPAHERVAIAEATLQVYVVSQSNGQEIVASVAQVNAPWVPREVSWQNASGGTPWSEAGCNGVPADRTDVQYDDQVKINQAGTWVSFDVTEMARDWQADPASNNGVVIKTVASGGSVLYKLAGVDHGTVAWRPVLKVRYTELPEPTFTPTPTATATPTPCVSVVKTGPDGPLQVGQYYTVTYQIDVANPGPQDISDVVVTDMLPVGTEFIEGSDGCVYDADTSMVSWMIDSIPAGGELNLTISLGLVDWVLEDGSIVNLAIADCAECSAKAESYWDIAIDVPTPTPTPTKIRRLIPLIFNDGSH